MIPKVIHYCWFGRNPKPKLFQKCYKSWKKYCPDYNIIEWNEDNFDISSCPLYVKQAYEAKKWAFVTDYVRLSIVYEHGGIYLDTDVELINNIDALLAYNAFFGFENENYVATGLGFGANKGESILKQLMEDYYDIPFILPNGNYDLLPCPQRNSNVFLKQGLLQNNNIQIICDGIVILPSDYLNPINYQTGIMVKTKNTLSIHHFAASWHSLEDRKKRKERERRLKKEYLIDYFVHIPNRILKYFLGEIKYNTLKKSLRKFVKPNAKKD